MKWIAWGLIIIMHQGLEDWLNILTKLEILKIFYEILRWLTFTCNYEWLE